MIRMHDLRLNSVPADTQIGLHHITKLENARSGANLTQKPRDFVTVQLELPAVG